MKHTQTLLKAITLSFAFGGTVWAQDATSYHFDSDVANRGWKVATISPSGSRPLRLANRATRWVTLRINRVAQIDNLDQGDMVGKNRADFYAMVFVDGRVYKSRNFSRDDGNPGWVLRVPLRSSAATFRIRLMDDDGGLEQKDDHVDINPMRGQKDLNLRVNKATRRIAGSVYGRTGHWFTTQGRGDDDKGRIRFSLS